MLKSVFRNQKGRAPAQLAFAAMGLLAVAAAAATASEGARDMGALGSEAHAPVSPSASEGMAR